MPWKLEVPARCWTHLLAARLDKKLVLRAEEGCDNTFIYSSIMHDLPEYSSDDLIIVGWTHPNRKSFVLDKNNPLHLEEIQKGALVYKGDPIWFRSNNLDAKATFANWMKLSPIKRGNKFFDTWFSNYHSDYEQKLNFRAYHDSSIFRIKCKLLNFYFSKESVAGMDIPKDSLTYLEFVVDNKLWISSDDLHCSEKGHQLLADRLQNMAKLS